MGLRGAKSCEGDLKPSYGGATKGAFLQEVVYPSRHHVTWYKNLNYKNVNLPQINLSQTGEECLKHTDSHVTRSLKLFFNNMILYSSKILRYGYIRSLTRFQFLCL